MQNNIGTVDRYIRLTAGLLALSTGSTMRRPAMTRTLLMSFGAMKVAEGVTGWCPIAHITDRVNASSQSGAAHGRQDNSQQQSSDPSATGDRPSQEASDNTQIDHGTSDATGQTHDNRTHRHDSTGALH